MIEITFSTMVELLGMEVEKEVNVDFNEVFQRMTLDAIGRETFAFNMSLIFVITLMCHFHFHCHFSMRSFRG